MRELTERVAGEGYQGERGGGLGGRAALRLPGSRSATSGPTGRWLSSLAKEFLSPEAAMLEEGTGSSPSAAGTPAGRRISCAHGSRLRGQASGVSGPCRDA